VIEPSGNCTERIQRASLRTSATEKPGRSEGREGASDDAAEDGAPWVAEPFPDPPALPASAEDPADPPGEVVAVVVVVVVVERTWPVPPAGGLVEGPAGTPATGGAADVGALGEAATRGEGRRGTTGFATPWARATVKADSSTESNDTSHRTQAMPIQRQEAPAA